jgi:hypothetical protein
MKRKININNQGITEQVQWVRQGHKCKLQGVTALE